MATITDVKFSATHELRRSVVSLQSIVNAAHSRDRLLESLNRTSRWMSKVIQDRRELNQLVDTVTFHSPSLQLDLRPQSNTFPVYIPTPHLGSGPFQEDMERGGEIFDDFLEDAGNLLDWGYKDAAAVITGNSLESHLKQLSLNRGIDTERRVKSGIRHIKVEELNASLAKIQVYSKLDQKSVTAWLGIRNEAAHGNYDEYTDQQVALMIDGVRDFIDRNPE